MDLITKSILIHSLLFIHNNQFKNINYKIKKFFDISLKNYYLYNINKSMLPHKRRTISWDDLKIYFFNWGRRVRFFNLELRDEEINSLIEKCKDGNNPKAWNKFLKLFSKIIYNFPRLINSVEDDDFCSDFYLYVVEHLQYGKKLKTFNPELSKFNTWFNTVLRNFYYELKNKKKREEINISLSLDNYKYNDSEIRVIDTIEDNSFFNITEIESEKVLRIKKAVESLPLKLRVTLKLQYLFYYDYPRDIKVSELRYIQKEAGLSFREIIIRIEVIKRELNLKYKKNKTLEQKLNKYFYELINIKNKMVILENKIAKIENLNIQYPSDLKKLNKLIEEHNLLLKKKEKKEKLMAKIINTMKKGNYVILAGKNNIAYILNINPSTIGTRLYRINKILYDKLINILND